MNLERQLLSDFLRVKNNREIHCIDIGFRSLIGKAVAVEVSVVNMKVDI